MPPSLKWVWVLDFPATVWTERFLTASNFSSEHFSCKKKFAAGAPRCRRPNLPENRCKIGGGYNMAPTIKNTCCSDFGLKNYYKHYLRQKKIRGSSNLTNHLFSSSQYRSKPFFALFLKFRIKMFENQKGRGPKRRRDEIRDRTTFHIMQRPVEN